MIKVKISYDNAAEKDKLISSIKNDFKVLHKSKTYKGKGQYKKIYLDMSNI